MTRRSAIVLCLVFSGLSALVYQLIWTRLLGFTFGTTTEAVSTVLAVFFGGLALGNLLAARRLGRVRRPLRVYAWLELAIGLFALLSLPLLRRLDAATAWLGVPESDAAVAALRVGVAAAVLLPPTVAMGATLPVVARGLVDRDGTRGRWSAILYGANTFGAVLGAYLCGFWLIPGLGLTGSVLCAAFVNLLVAGVVLLAGRGLAAAPEAPRQTTAPASGAVPEAAFLVFFGVSGFVAIGYEIVWSKVFGIVMEGTLYGFAAVLTAYLLGIALGSIAVSRRVDAIRDLPRAFALLHVAIGASVAASMAAVPYLPYAYDRLAEVAPAGDAVHHLFLLVLPLVLVPTALFGAAFPVLIRMLTRRADGVARGMGVATAVNTGGSIAASLVVGFWWIPSLGTDASLYLLLLLDFAVALLVLLHYQAEPGRARLAPLGGAAALVALVAVSYNGVRIEEAIAGRQLESGSLAEYERGLARAASIRALTVEGRTSIVSVYATPTGRLLRTNGLPEAGFGYAPPYYPRESVSLGLLPYLAAETPRRALVIGLGGGNTVTALLTTSLRSIEVVELERGVVRAVEVMHEGRANPLDDPRVALRINDGRYDLAMATRAGRAGYDLITSQPSHPWRVGAANLFTEDFFRIAHDGLAEGGVFASWLNGFRMDPESLLAVIASFERVFPGAVLVDIGAGRRQSFLLLGGRAPLRLDAEAMRRRLAEPRVAALLGEFGVHDLETLLADVEGPAAVFAALDPEASNTDDNAFVETRIPRMLHWRPLDFSALEARLPADAPLLPEVDGALDLAALGRALLDAGGATHWPYGPKLARLIATERDALGAFDAELLRAEAALRRPESRDAAREALTALARAHPDRPEPLRALAADRARQGDWRAAADAWAAAHARSGDDDDAWEAGRALHSIDPEGAWRWFERLGAEARAAHPDLAIYAARRSLSRGVRGPALGPDYTALRAAVEAGAGRGDPAVHELLARLAAEVGDGLAARGHADTSARLRRAQGERSLDLAEAALDEGRNADARSALAHAATLLPAEGRLHVLRARLALAEQRPDELDSAFAALRRWAPSPRDARAAENRFRTRHAMPLLLMPGPAPDPR